MATIAFDSSEAQAKPPLSAHPAFPAIVALWFAVLFGLGSLVLPAALLESAVTATGIASLVPAAAPPLGLTARALIALAAALAGAALGIAIGRRVEQSQRPDTATRRASGQRAPLNIKDELGAEGLAGEGLPITRRRALAISDDAYAGDDPYAGPLPGEREAAIELSFDHDEFGDEFGDAEPLELSTPADDDRADSFPPGFADEPVADEDFEMSEQPDFRPEEPAPSWQAETPAEPHDENDAEPWAPVAAVEAAGEPAMASEWTDAPLEELGLVQLVQRLGSTIERRREVLAQTAVAPVASGVASGPAAQVRVAPVIFGAARADDAAQATAAYFGGGARTEAGEPADIPAPTGLRPEFLRSLDLGEAEDDKDTVLDLDLPLDRPAPTVPDFTAAHDDESEDEDAEDAEEAEDTGAGYSSLLGISHPFARLDDDSAPRERLEAEDDEEAAEERPFDPPAAESAPRNADAALRSALATLQKMSGTA